MKFEYHKQARRVLIFGTAIILISPLLFTRSLGIIDFTNTGEIGDTIGGITAPFASLLGSILVFFALRAQIDANLLIQNQIASQKQEEENNKVLRYFLDQYKIIREDINNFSINEVRNNQHAYLYPNKNSNTTVVTHHGSSAFFYVLYSSKDLMSIHPFEMLQTNPKLNEVISLLNSLDNLLSKILDSGIPRDDREYHINMIAHLFNTKLRAAFDANEMYKKKAEKDGKYYGIPDHFFEKVQSIKNKLDTRRQ